MCRQKRLVGLVLFCVMGMLTVSASLGQPGTEKSQSATIVVRLTDENAKLTVDGDATTQKGKERKFISPKLLPGKRYSYTLIATWEPNDYTTIKRTHVVSFKIGETVTADMRTAQDGRLDSVVATYGPTPERIAEAMCKLAKVGKDDVVYDLGCGDGILMITAVKKYGAKKGVGIDIDPKWVKTSREKAKEAGISDKIEVRQGDVLKIKEMSEATVVMLFIGETLNVRIRSMLQKTLPHGARIVSHNFRMGDWEPEKSVPFRGSEDGDDEHAVHLWRIEKKK